jgi:hypothetical protein
MSPEAAMSLMNVAELGLWEALCLVFWRKNLFRRFPYTGSYLALRAATAPLFVVLFYGQAHHWHHNLSFFWYFYTFWSVYLAGAILTFLICLELYRSALSGFSGLVKLGTVAFRWAALISVVVSLSSVSYHHLNFKLLPSVANELMRSVSILELCLLAFLCLSMRALGLSLRNSVMGIALGLGLLSANDVIQSALSTMYTSVTAPIQFVGEAVTLLGLGCWVAYFALPELVRKPVVLPVNSTILRWNEIASALGHTGTKVAVQHSASGFFLTDVEKAVEEALTRNLESRESEI